MGLLMTSIDLGIANQLVQGGSVFALVVLVIYVLKQSSEREKTMRDSFAEREHQFIAALDTNSQKFSDALTQTIGENTAALAELSTKLSTSLEEMRRHIQR